MDYAEFLASKSQLKCGSGFSATFLPDCLFDFQRVLVEWAVRQGRAALFADTGLGKTLMELVWAENVVQHTNQPVLLLAPLAVGQQTVKEAQRFGIDAIRSSDGRLPQVARIVVTNYERLHYFDPDSFSGVVCDESSILKNFDGKRKAAVTEFMRTRPYRLLCTATAAPNDYIELGTSSEALGEMGYQDMITRFFKKVLANRGTVGWGQVDAYRLRAHAETHFWRWVCSWSRSCRKPSDLGFDDGPFALPPLSINLHEVKAARPAAGFLFDLPARTMSEQREEQRRTLTERIGMAASLVLAHNDPAVCWCHLNDEADELERAIPGAVQVSGADELDVKEEKLVAFGSGQIRVLVTKPKLAGFGLNWQHCAHQTCFPSYSWEAWYQSVRRCWRFGQTRPVVVDVVTTEGGANVLASLQRKQEAAEKMFDQLVAHMNNQLRIEYENKFTRQEKLPQWLSSIRN